MTPERTNYLTNGVDGIKRLAQGPELSSYRGLQIIPTRKFSMDAGTAPRDLLKRRVRVAEYYRIPYHPTNHNKMYEFYDQSRDTMFKLTYQQLLDMADLGSPDDGSDGNGKWRHGKRGLTTSYNSWKPNDVSDGVFVSTNAEDPADGLNLPSILPSAGRDKKKFKTEDTTGANLSSHKNNMSVIDALRSISTPEYHIASETFGGGLFNDPIKSGSGVATNFDAIDNPTKSIGHTFIPWLMAKGMKRLGEDKNDIAYFQQMTSLEHSIQTGQGSPADLDCIIKMLWHRACNHYSHLKDQKVNDADIIHYHREEILLKLQSAAVKNHFRNFLQEPATTTHLTQYFGTANVWNGKTPVQMLDEFENPTLTAEINAAQTSAENLLRRTYGGIGNNFDALVSAPTIEATTQYIEFLKSWSSDIFLEKAIRGFIHPSVPDRDKANVIGGQAHHKFPQLKSMIKADYILKSLTVIAQNSHIEIDSSHADHIARITTAFMTTSNDALKPVIKYFRNEMHEHSEHAIIASNVANAGKFQQAFRPNLHITRCAPLCNADVESSPSSMNQSTWLIQHLASTMPLTDKMCNVLTAIGSSSPHQRQAYKQFLTGNSNNADEDPYDTLLMHWLMSKIHPDHNIRNHASKYCKITEEDEDYLVKNVADLLRDNTTFNHSIESAFETILPNSFMNGSGGAFYCPGVAAQYYPNMPSHIKLSDASCSCVGSDIEWSKMPVVDFQTFNAGADTGSYYNAESGQNEATYDTTPSYAKMPWIYRLSESTSQSNRKDLICYMSALKCHWFLMSFENESVNGMHTKNDICCDDLKYLLQNSIGLCSSNSDAVVRTMLLVFANRFWKPSSRAIMNGMGVPIAKQTTDSSLIRVSMNQTNEKAAPVVTEQWVVQGSGCHLMHGPRTLGVGGGGAGNGAHDIVILRPNIEHEMLGIIMGRGGTQELGATFWYVFDKIDACTLSCLCCEVY